jgi:type II secretory pathway component PulK
MKHPRQNGFVLILVVVAIAVIGAEMIALTGSANKILFQSETAYLRACERNLVTSGLAWAKRNIKNEDKETFDRPIELDVASLSIHGATLNVKIVAPKDEEAEVQIKTSCSRDRLTLRHNDKYRIGLKH